MNPPADKMSLSVCDKIEARYYESLRPEARRFPAVWAGS
jgi:hypothetical protein